MNNYIKMPNYAPQYSVKNIIFILKERNVRQVKSYFIQQTWAFPVISPEKQIAQET